MFHLCIFKQVQNDLFICLLLLLQLLLLSLLLFRRFRLALQINCNASLFISYNSCKFDRH